MKDEDLIRALIREEIAGLLNDDALVGKFDAPGMLSGYDEFSAPEKYKKCKSCGQSHDGPCDKSHDKKTSYMARPQLHRISKYATSILGMVEDGDQLDDWIESYIAQAEQMLDAVYGKLDFKNSRHHD